MKTKPYWEKSEKKNGRSKRKEKIKVTPQFGKSGNIWPFSSLIGYYYPDYPSSWECPAFISPANRLLTALRHSVGGSSEPLPGLVTQNRKAQTKLRPSYIYMRLRACILPDNMVRCNWSIGENFLFPFITAEILHIKKKEYNQSLRLYA